MNHNEMENSVHNTTASKRLNSSQNKNKNLENVNNKSNFYHNT